MAGLRNLGRTSKRTGKQGIKFAIEIKSDQLLFNPDEKPIAAAMAAAIAAACKKNLLAGKAPTGASLPGIGGSTTTRREQEAAQGRRGGAPDERYKDQSFIDRAKADHAWQYTGLGKTWVPVTGGPRGVLSGLLAHSFAARPRSDGKGWIVFVSAKRSRNRRGSGPTALETVFRGIPLWSAAAFEQPDIIAARRAAAKAMLGNDLRTILNNAKKIGQSIKKVDEELRKDDEF